MTNPNPTQGEVQRELCIDIDSHRQDIERLLGKVGLLRDYVRDDFGQGSARVANKIGEAIDALEEAHSAIDYAYAIATGDED